MNSRLILLPCLMGVFLALVCVHATTEKVVCCEEVKSLLKRPDVVVIDLRRGESESGSLTVPHSIREDPANVPSWACKYSRNATILLYCS